VLGTVTADEPPVLVVIIGLRSIPAMHGGQRTSMRVFVVRARSLHCTGYARKYGVRIASYQSNRSNHEYQDNGQHYRIFGDVLALLVPPQELPKKMTHVCASVTTERTFCIRDPENSCPVFGSCASVAPWIGPLDCPP
jgi:hypothetical protein